MSATAALAHDKVLEKPSVDNFAIAEQIGALAEELWLQRTGESGFDVTDWLKAEEEYRNPGKNRHRGPIGFSLNNCDRRRPVMDFPSLQSLSNDLCPERT